MDEEEQLAVPLLEGDHAALARRPLVAPADEHKAAEQQQRRPWWRSPRVKVLLVVAAVAGLLTKFQPVGTHLPCPFCLVSSLVGWLYFCLWTVSFYPQLIANWRRKSVEGLSLDYLALNVLGFACYSIFNLGIVLSPRVLEEYRERFGTVGVPVELNDVLFGLHALLLSLALAVQVLIYPRGSARLSLGTSLAIAAAVAGGAFYAGALALHGEGDEPPFTWLDFCYAASAVKMAVSLVKYVPQVVLNSRRRSTLGWSIDNILLDLGGGVLSVAQLLISCQVLRDWSAVTGNPIKLGLGLCSIAFDVVFMLQHYVWFRASATAVLPQHHQHHHQHAAPPGQQQQQQQQHGGSVGGARGEAPAWRASCDAGGGAAAAAV